MRRAGEGWGEAVELVSATVRCCTRLPAKALQILASALRQIGHRWLTELEIPTLEPASSLPPTAIGDPVSAEPAVPSDNGPPERTGAGQQHEAGIGQGNAIVKLATTRLMPPPPRSP